LSVLTLARKRRPALVLGYSGHGEAAMARAVEIMAGALTERTGLTDTIKADLLSDQLAR
jgi:hypothetical protein